MMFTCPSNDIHSVYLDNELTPSYSAQYEEHIKQCSKCMEQLKKLQKVKSMLSTVSLQEKSIDLSDSWERLQIKKKYYANTKSESQKSPTLKTWLPLAAAAAFLAIVLPFRMTQVQSKNIATTIVPITRQSNAPIAQKNIIINGNITPGQVYSVSNRAFSEDEFFVNLDNADVFKPNIQSNKVNVRIILPEQSFIANMPISYGVSVLP